MPDARAIITQGLFPAVASEQPTRIITQGYIGTVESVLAKTIFIEVCGWLIKAITSHFKWFFSSAIKGA